jgi:hypothetical protein
MAKAVNLSDTLSSIYKMTDMADLAEVIEAAKQRQLILQQQRDEDTLDDEWNDVAAPV